MYKINAAELEAVSLAASHEQSRYYLNGVCLEPYEDNTVGMIATDGHRLHTMHVKRDAAVPEGSFIIGNDDIAKALSLYKAAVKGLARSMRDMLTLQVTADTITVMLGGDIPQGSFSYKPVDANFPDWRRVFPSGEAGAPNVAFNGAYITDFAKASKILGNRVPHLQLVPHGNTGPMLVNIRYAGFVGVLMPARF